MRRVVRDRVAASFELAKPRLAQWIAAHLRYPPGFPYALADPSVSIREMRSLRLTPAAKADYPPVDLEATMRGSLAAPRRDAPGDPAPRRLDVDLRLLARATVRGDGSYEIAPRSATVKAWWQGMEPRSRRRSGWPPLRGRARG